MMRLALSADQTAIAEAVRQALAGLDPVDPADPPDQSGPAYQDAVWARLVTVGLTSALLAPDEGGLGLNEVDVVAGLVETGRFAAPVPLVETALVAVRLLSGTAHADLLAGGTARIAAVLEPSGLAAWTTGADGILAGDDASVFRYATAEPVGSLDPGRPLGRVQPGTGALVCSDPARIGAARRAGTLGTAAQLIGLAEKALELTVGYTAQREQFGVPIGTFQAVKHQLADAYVALDLARPLVWAAAWSHSRDSADAGRDVAAAKLRAGDAAALVARAALQCHGGMGYTREHELHRWLLRIWALRAAWGAAGDLTTALAASLGLSRHDPAGPGLTTTAERTTADA